MTIKFTLGYLLAAIAALAVPLFASAQNGTAEQVQAEEQALWQSYNNCDHAAFGARLATDIEFYHDLGGVMKGKAAVVDAVRNNICGDREHKIRREAAADVKVSLLKQGEQVYGAVVSGSHLFHGKHGSASEAAESRARFTHVWLQKGGVWELSRVVSYDHGPFGAAPATPLATTAMTAAQIDRYVGNFAGPGMPPLAFSRADGNLTVAFEGKQLILHPLAKANAFTIKENNAEVEFAEPANGKSDRVVIRLNGRSIGEAKRK